MFPVGWKIFEAEPAVRAVVGPLLGVHSLVRGAGRPLAEGLVAILALVGLLARVEPLVRFDGAGRPELSLIHI